MQVLLISSMYPSEANPSLGIFIKRQVRHLSDLDVKIDLVANSIGPGRAIVRKYLRLAVDVAGRRATPFDLIHVHWPVVPGILGWLLARWRRRPLVVTVHGGEIDPSEIFSIEMGSQKRQLTRLIAGWVLRRADSVIVVGRYLVDVARRLGVPESRIAVINMGVDTTEFYPRARAQARARLGIEPDRLVLLSVGSLTPVKGHAYLIGAMPAIQRHHPSCHLYVVGDGPLQARLQAQTDELEIAERVTFVGPRPPDEIVWWLSAADLVIVPSIAESFGLVAVEALACGIPVVASRVGGLVEHIVDGENGFLVPPGDSRSIAEKVDALLSDLARRMSMRTRCISTAKSVDARIQAQKVLDLYRTIAGGANRQ